MNVGRTERARQSGAIEIGFSVGIETAIELNEFLVVENIIGNSEEKFN